eukprot:m.16065 g.16065  ORF g.16065 m.16065 type:complete len:167 (-) comp10536_c0_seq1:78-578(-)
MDASNVTKTAKTAKAGKPGRQSGSKPARGRGRGRGSSASRRGRGSHAAGDGAARSKRQPARLARSRTDIYIGRNSPFEAQLARAQSLFSSGEKSLTLHGLGAAINRCINLALQLEHQAKGSLQLDLKTDSVALLDDLPADDPDATPKIVKRTSSAVHIRVFKTDST